jgi:hypothetical protein
MPDDGDDVTLLLRAQFLPAWNSMPFRKATAAAGRRGMLGYKDGMPAHRRLLAVILVD